MRCFRRMDGLWLGAAVLAGGVSVPGAVAERAVAVEKTIAGTQTVAGQGTEHDRTVEAEASELLASGRYIAVLDACKEASSPSALLLNYQGVAYEHLGGFDNARLSYEESIKLNPKYSNVYNNLGTVFYARHDNKMAIRMYKKAIRLDSKSASAYKNLGAAYFHEGKFRRGSEAFEEAMQFGSCEAVEKEVGDDEIVGAPGVEGAGVCLVGDEAVCGC